MINIKKLINNNNWDKISNLIRLNKIDLGKKINDGNTIVHLATINNNDSIIKYLLNNNIDELKKINKYGDTPIHLLASFGYTNLLKDCLSVDNNFINLLNNNDENVLNILYNDFNFIKWVSDNIKNANFNNVTKKNETLITLNIKHNNNDNNNSYTILKFVLSNCNINLNLPKKNPPLCICCNLNNEHIINLILNNKNNKTTKININIKDENFITPFLYACKNQSYDIMNKLIKYPKFNINYIGPEGQYNPIILAIENTDTIMIDILLKNGFDINLTDKQLNSPLHYSLTKKIYLRKS